MSISLLSFHHVAIIVSDYERSKAFYTEVLGFSVRGEHYREERGSFKLDLIGPGGMQLEIFSFPAPPARVSRPEACGLRHLAFRVANIDQEVARLRERGVVVESIRTDEYTGQRFTFFSDPDGLPLELYEDLKLRV
jgi:glyoxylase I family protein